MVSDPVGSAQICSKHQKGSEQLDVLNAGLILFFFRYAGLHIESTATLHQDLVVAEPATLGQLCDIKGVLLLSNSCVAN
jgi:hypothetical protein